MSSDVVVRPVRPEDLDACAKICFRAFRDIARRHGFPPDFESQDMTRRAFGAFGEDSLAFGVVAERDGHVIGSTFAHDRHPVAGVGPVTVDPSSQDQGVGRRMMEAVLEWTRRKEFPSVRLVQSAYHTRSLSLYASLGFEAREPLSCLQGPAIGEVMPGYDVRPAAPADVEATAAVGTAVHGFARSVEVARGIERGAATVVEREGRITAYASDVAFWGHAAAETDEDLKALIGAAPAFGGPGFLLPTRSAELLRWCLARGLRIVQPMTLMTMGWYQGPTGAYLPSVGF